MTRIKHSNEMIKRSFLKYLRESKGFSETSIRSYSDAIVLWQEFTQEKELTQFSGDDAIAFRNWLKGRRKHGTSKTVSLSFCYDVLRFLRVFFTWLAEQGDFRADVSKTDVDYLRLSKKENQVVITARGVRCPTLDEVKKTIEFIDPVTEIDMRDRALLSLALLTGARIRALSSLTLQCFDEKSRTLTQDPNFGVDTKFSKRIVTVLLPLSYKEPLEYFLEWYRYLSDRKGFGPEDPIFPATKHVQASESNVVGFYSSNEVSNQKWVTTGPARKIFQKRFKAAGVQYYNPHSFRHLLVQEIMKLPLTEEQKKAVSQNFGHEHIGTTFWTYGYRALNENRQKELLQDLVSGKGTTGQVYNLTDEQLARLVQIAIEQRDKGV